MEYLVSYEVELTADSIRKAAEEAFRIMTDPASMRPILAVKPLTPDAEWEPVDLNEEVEPMVNR